MRPMLRSHSWSICKTPWGLVPRSQRSNLLIHRDQHSQFFTLHSRWTVNNAFTHPRQWLPSPPVVLSASKAVTMMNQSLILSSSNVAKQCKRCQILSEWKPVCCWTQKAWLARARSNLHPTDMYGNFPGLIPYIVILTEREPDCAYSSAN